MFQADKGAKLDFEIGLTLSTREPISYLEIIKNGKVEHSIPFDKYSKSGKLPTLHFDRSGWFLVRAVTDLPKTYRFAMTGAVLRRDRPRSGGSARARPSSFVDWVYERAKQIKLDDPEQQKEVLQWHRHARDYWQDLLSKANAE